MIIIYESDMVHDRRDQLYIVPDFCLNSVTSKAAARGKALPTRWMHKREREKKKNTEIAGESK